MLSADEDLSPQLVDEMWAGFEQTYLRHAPSAWKESPEGKAEIRREIVSKW
jgi:hypothetical protein